MPTVDDLAKGLLEHLIAQQDGLQTREEEIIAEQVAAHTATHGQPPIPGGGDMDAINMRAQRKVMDEFFGMAGQYFFEHVQWLTLDDIASFPSKVDMHFNQYEEDIFIDQDQLKLYLRGLSQYKSSIPQLRGAVESVATLPRGIDANELWQLLIDGKRQHAKTNFYEFDAHEPGYIQGTVSALTRALFQIGTRVSAESILTLQEAATSNVHDRDGGGLFSGYRGSLTMTFAVTKGETASEAGLAELQRRTTTQEDVLFGWLELNELSEGKVQYNYRIATQDEMRVRLEKVSANYEANIAAAHTDDEKMTAIATLVQSIDQLHVFGDANIRTAYVLANRLMVENGMLPMILYNPNILDGFTIPEIVEEFKKGQQTFDDMCVPKGRPRSNAFIEYPDDDEVIITRRARSGAMIDQLAVLTED